MSLRLGKVTGSWDGGGFECTLHVQLAFVWNGAIWYGSGNIGAVQYLPQHECSPRHGSTVAAYVHPSMQGIMDPSRTPALPALPALLVLLHGCRPAAGHLWRPDLSLRPHVPAERCLGAAPQQLDLGTAVPAQALHAQVPANCGWGGGSAS